MIRNVLATTTTAIAILLVVSAPVVVVDAARKKNKITRENWPELTMGKKVVMFFQYPWCQHCKTFKPIWHSIRRKLESDDLVFLDADCEDEEETKICEDFGVSAVPHIRWGNTATTFRYTGELEEQPFETYITDTIIPEKICSILDPDNCPEEDREKIIAIDKLTTEYLTKITSLKHEDPVKMAQQTVLKAGFENPFWEDSSGIHQAYGYQAEEELFTSSRASIREQIRLAREREAMEEYDDDDDMAEFKASLDGEL